ncbi:lactadherin-like [Amphiura filiformis]|uniref:lactadherin-like n=1 Tax=Amphiura filiformis TaxID=82378 RepID=UPI003B217855
MMTLELCFKHCGSSGHAYAGLQASRQCWCGYVTDNYSRHGTASENECSSPCPGNDQQKCGGHWRNAVYGLNCTCCVRPLGMENYEIADDKITASSYHNEDRLPQYGRLNHDETWTSKPDDNASWIQVNLGQEMIVTGVVTQGYQSVESGKRYCVKEFRAKTGLTETSLSPLQDNAGTGEKTFIIECTYTTSGVMSEFPSRPRAQFVRIEPINCYQSIGNTNMLCVLRFEVLGCFPP